MPYTMDAWPIKTRAPYANHHGKNASAYLANTSTDSPPKCATDIIKLNNDIGNVNWEDNDND